MTIAIDKYALYAMRNEEGGGHGDHDGEHDHGDHGEEHGGEHGEEHGDSNGEGTENNPTAEAGDHSAHAAHRAFLFTEPRNFFLLFSGAQISSGGDFAGALIVSLLFAMATTLASFYLKRAERSMSADAKFLGTTVGSIFYALRMLFHYVNMLIVMTMQVYIILAVLVGHALGFFVFAMIEGRRKPNSHAAAAEKEAALAAGNKRDEGCCCE
mmetsp:Transcript_55668/g.136643  ORF Transcript_55668/g.136643 Transcript_55668/m.136643 type:complete len:212 (-) Transcript_55668:793-1428(-)